MDQQQAVEPGTERTVLSLHKRADRSTLTLVDPQCCGGTTAIRVVPAPFFAPPLGLKRDVWANVWWNGRSWLCELYNAGGLTVHQSLGEAMRRAWNGVGSSVSVVPDDWHEAARQLPDIASVSPSEEHMHQHEVWHAPYWKEIERELDDLSDEQFGEPFDELEEENFYDDDEGLEPTDDYEIMLP